MKNHWVRKDKATAEDPSVNNKTFKNMGSSNNNHVGTTEVVDTTNMDVVFLELVEDPEKVET